MESTDLPVTALCALLDPANNACNPGSSKNSSGICSLCIAGTYSLTGTVCTPCQKGTASNVTGAKSYCPACLAGSFSSSVSSANCSSCPSSSNCQIGSFASTRAYSPVVQLENQTKVDKNGHIIQPGVSTVSGWAFLGPMFGFVVVSTIILVPLRRRVRRPVSAISVILRTPFSFLRIVPSSWTVVEIPSFYRGLVSLWVTAGVTIITAYQSEVFVNQAVISLSSVQPGSTFNPRRRLMPPFPFRWCFIKLQSPAILLNLLCRLLHPTSPRQVR